MDIRGKSGKRKTQRKEPAQQSLCLNGKVGVTYPERLPPPNCPPLHPEIPAGTPTEGTAPVGKTLWTEEPSYPMQTLLSPTTLFGRCTFSCDIISC